MATTTDLTGLGVPPSLANLLGVDYSVITGVGTSQSGAPTILSGNCVVQSASGATAIILNSNAPLGTKFRVSNPGTIGSAATALVFVPVGHTLSNGTNGIINQAYSLATYSTVILWQAQTKQWYVK